MKQAILSPQNSYLTAYPRLLLVEDDHITQMIYQHYLKKLHYQVDLIETGKEAIELAHLNHYSAMVLDVGLPDMSGEDVLLAIREREKKSTYHLPILIATAHSYEEQLARYRHRGADATFIKPVSLETFRRILKLVCPLHQA